MALDFPASPTTGQTYTSGGQTWTYNGVGWASTYQASGFVRQAFTATAGQTVFTVVGGYTPTLIDVYQNGVKLINGTDVTVTSGTTITLATGAVANDIIEVLGIAAVANTPFLPLAGGTMIGAITFAAAQTIAGTLLTNTSVGVGKLNATGTPSASNFLRGDGSWNTPSSGFSNMQVYTSGTNTWTIPAGITQCKVTVVGGGGGGGGGASGAGGGGGAGGCSIRYVTGLTPGGTVTATVGAGGAGGTSNNNGSAGGTSSFGAYASATGGSGGGGATFLGGAGGTGSSGNLNISGGYGGAGAILAIGDINMGGFGGNSVLGGGGRNGSYSNSGQTITATAGAANTGGGGGGGTVSGGSTGGAGGSGVVIIEY